MSAPGPGPGPGPRAARTAAALIIGNEILSGKTVDTNSPLLARELRDLGVDLLRVLVVPDAEDDIVEGVQALVPRYDLVFTSGGVGPTHDDITFAAVAKALGRKLVRHPELERVIRAHYDVARDVHALRMADVPEGAELVWGEGMRVPVVVVGNAYVLPGVPSIFERKLRSIRERFRAEPFHLRQVFVTEGEVEIANALFALVAAHPGLLLGSYPVLDDPDHQVKLTLESRDPELVERALADLLARLPAAWIRRVV